MTLKTTFKSLLTATLFLAGTQVWAQEEQVNGLNGWSTQSIFTIGNDVDGYYPPGIPDGMGAKMIGDDMMRLYVNHELSDDDGYIYGLTSGATMTGARVSYFDINTDNFMVMDAGLAYETMYDRTGALVTMASQINEEGDPTNGLDRLCSASLFRAGDYNLEDDIFMTGEETFNGQEFALDVENGEMYCLPWLGRAAWENITFLDPGDDSKVAILVGDDSAGAPLYLYVGEKNHIGDGSFTDRNGLAFGKLYVWVADAGYASPEEWAGTGNSALGSFVEIEHYNPDSAGTEGYDDLGFADQDTQYELAFDGLGAFSFSRPEDVATNPDRPTEAILASTGRSSLYPADSWGTMYRVLVDFSNMNNIRARLIIIYDGDDAGAGQFADPDEGLRSPDNLDWAANGYVYVQEDRSIGGFGDISGQEASIWEMNASTGKMARVAQINRIADLPAGQFDDDPSDLGDWESSGIIDVTNMLNKKDGFTYLIGNVQAHSVTGGTITSEILEQGGQLFVMRRTNRNLATADKYVKTVDSDWIIKPLATVGENFDGYVLPGIPDGMGAIGLGQGIIRVFVNHEFVMDAGYAYQLSNGAELTGARVSYLDIRGGNSTIVDAGLAYDRIFDREGNLVADGTQINPDNAPSEGINRLCSASLFEEGEYNLADDIFFTGEETFNGQEFLLDVVNHNLWCAPWLGRAAWENVTLLNPGNENQVAVLVGDDSAGAPLYLYIGEKNHVGDNSFLDRNGFAFGHLYVWVADDLVASPEEWAGTGETKSGTWVEISHYQPDMAGTEGFDAMGFADQDKQYELAFGEGAFSFSRPEDVATDPADDTRAVIASTGRSSLYPADSWGTMYLIDVDFENMTAEIEILYDGDDAGAGQFSHPDEGLRSPDNLDWAANGFIYVQEDRSFGEFGDVSGEEASIFELNPNTGELNRIAQVNRDADLPFNQVDIDPDDLGDWETSGILDVSGFANGRNILILNTQAHSVREGVISREDLVQGGQILVMEGPQGSPSEVADNGDVLPESSNMDQMPSVDVYPNPTVDFLNVSLPSYDEAVQGSLRLYDIKGKLIKEQVVNSESGLVQLDLSGLPEGAYTLSLKMGGTRSTQTVIKK